MRTKTVNFKCCCCFFIFLFLDLFFKYNTAFFQLSYQAIILLVFIYSYCLCSGWPVRSPSTKIKICSDVSLWTISFRYRKHLDWHFRQNRREKDGVKAVQSRKWFYEVDQWLDFEEINEVDEGKQSFLFPTHNFFSFFKKLRNEEYVCKKP